LGLASGRREEEEEELVWEKHVLFVFACAEVANLLLAHARLRKLDSASRHLRKGFWMKKDLRRIRTIAR
jgi:hypothetical protein